MEIDLPQKSFDAAPLVVGQVPAGEPAPADTAEQVRVRARRHKVPRQDRMHLVLQPSALFHQMHPASHQPAPIGESGARAGQCPVEAGDECCHLFAGDGLLG